MSVSVTPLVPTRIIDPRVNTNSYKNRFYGILESAIQSSWQIYSSTSFSANQITWSANPASNGIMTNRKFLVSVSFQITFVGTSAGPGITLLQAAGLASAPGVSPGTAHYDAPRCSPLLSSAVTTSTVRMGNDSITTNLNTYGRIFNRYFWSGKQQSQDYSQTPSMPDQSQNYADLDGFALNPLGPYGATCPNGAVPRGGFVDVLITRNDSTGAPGDTAVVLLTVTEPFYLSPWAWTDTDQVAFLGFQTLEVILNLGGRGNSSTSGLAGALWSHSPLGSVLSSAGAQVTQGNLLFNYLTPDPTYSLIPPFIYSLTQPNLYPTANLGAVSPGTPTQFIMNTVNLGSVPTLLYIWIAKSDVDIDIESTDTFFWITNVNITFINSQSLLANTSAFDLHQISVKNGCNVSWSAWKGYVGSVVCLKFGTDIALQSPTLAPGVRGNFALNMTVTGVNISQAPMNATLSVLTMEEGTMVIDGSGSVLRNIGVLSEQDVLNSKDLAPTPYAMSQNVYGSGWWSNLVDFGKSALGKVKSYIRPAIDVARTFAPHHPALLALDQGAKAYGYGWDEEDEMKAQRPRRRGRGGALVGGQMLSQKDLKYLDMLQE